MLKHEDMTQHFRDASSDTEMRDACQRDEERFYVDGAWWAGSSGKQFKNKPKPEFNKMWRSINRLMGDINDMELNAIIVANSDEATDDGASILQRRWRNDFQSSDGIEASEIATQEAVVGGFGCTKLVAKYDDEEMPDPDKQYLCAEIIQSACTSVYFDAGAIRKDKSDSRFGWHLIRTNRKKVEEEYGVDVVSFMSPASYMFNTNLHNGTQRDIYLAHYYEVVEKNLTIYDFSMMNGLKITSGDGIKDDMGNSYTRDDLKEIREIYVEMFGEEAPTQKRKIKFVEYALADGEKYLTKPQRIPFKRVPLFPRYGYYKVLNGKEYYCGEVRKQTDYEMFHNMFGSALMEIMSKPQVSKPEYLAEQIARHTSQRSRADLDNVPFLVSDIAYDKNGQPIVGPIATHQPPQLGTGLAASGQFLQSGIQEMGGIGQATVPSNASGDAIMQANERTDDAFLPVVKNVLHSIKAQCDAWIPAAQALYFSNQRKIRVLENDGTYTQITTLEMTQNENGEYGPYGNNPVGKYTVQVERGEAYMDSVQSAIKGNLELMAAVGSDTVAGQILAYKNMELMNETRDPMIEAISKFERLNLIIAKGIPYEPQNEEEAQYIAMKMQQMQMQQASQQDPMQVAAQAQMVEAQASMIDKQVDMFNAETKRMEAMVNAQKAGAEINIKQQGVQLKALESANKLRQSGSMV